VARYQTGGGRDLREELARHNNAFGNLEVRGFVMDTLNVAPARPVEGQTVKADGVNWNPGAGGGVYQWRGGAWVFVG
jgi:hypothetical protein